MDRAHTLPRLKYLVVETTRRCNLRCIHCAVSEENNLGNYDARDLPMDLFLKLLPTLRDFKPKVQLNGHGETLLHPNFMEMLEEVVRAGCQVRFQTNGTILTPRIVEKFVRLGVESIVISIDGASSEVFDRIRRRGRLEKIVENIRLINETKARLNSACPQLGFEFVAMRQNLHELPAVIKMAGELGACSLQVAELVEYNLTRGQSLANDPLMAEWAKKAETEARKWRINLLLPANIPGRQVAGPVSGAASIDPSNPATYKGLRKTCKEPWENMFVQYNGEVRPCCVITESYGNLSTQTFEEVWYGPKYQALRAALLTDGPSTKCVQCPFYGWEPIDRPQSATPADKASSAMAPLEVESLPANPGTVVSDITVAASQPTKSTVQVRRGWKGLVRKLLGARQCAPQLTDLQLLCLLNRLSCADPVAELERIRRGGHSISEACLALLERGQSLSNGAFVERIYRSLLDREPDENGLQGYWQALDGGLTRRVEVLGSFISSAEFQRMLLSPQWIEHPR